MATWTLPFQRSTAARRTSWMRRSQTLSGSRRNSSSSSSAWRGGSNQVVAGVLCTRHPGSRPSCPGRSWATRGGRRRPGTSCGTGRSPTCPRWPRPGPRTRSATRIRARAEPAPAGRGPVRSRNLHQGTVQPARPPFAGVASHVSHRSGLNPVGTVTRSPRFAWTLGPDGPPCAAGAGQRRARPCPARPSGCSGGQARSRTRGTRRPAAAPSGAGRRCRALASTCAL